MPFAYGEYDGTRDLEHAVANLGERLPAPLAPLAKLVYDYRWTWIPGAAALLRDLHPGLWTKSGCNPLWMVEATPPDRLRTLAADSTYLARLAEVTERLDSANAREPAWPDGSVRGPVAYFCSEFGAHCSLPLYGGGLGVLAGDVLKAASDLALPLVGIGLLYSQGYFHQRLDQKGWQHEYWISTYFERLPAVPVTGADGSPLAVDLPLRGRRVRLRVWRIDFGAVPLFLLDANHEENHPVDRWITHRLYIGDRHTRLAQYAALGAGGQRALRAMGIEPAVVHLNEGHAALAAFERMAPLLRQGIPAQEALERARAGAVFTTHTPIGAGNEWYSREEVEPVLDELRAELGIPPALFYGLGGFDPEKPDDSVAVTLLALRTSRASSAVSRRHGQVAREMWQRVWPDRPVAQVPITHVTNGVHVATWMAEPMQALLDAHLGPDWRERLSDRAFFDRIAELPDEALWAVRRELRARLVHMVRERSVIDRLSRGESPEYVEAADRVFDPDHLTIGFARRVATYKRLHLLTRRLDLGLPLLGDKERPIQVVIAGKAHPQDQEAKEALRSVLQIRHTSNVGSHIVFLEDYDLHMAPRIVAGVDLWLNLPRPPLEASGTSGMKVVANGGLHLSVLDGWWEEAYDGQCGWAISSPDGDAGLQDDRDAAALFNLLASEVVPLFYERDAGGIPRRWLQRVKLSMARLIPRFCAERMLRDYVDTLYTVRAGATSSRSPEA